jgi:hypothetical protein
MKMKMKTKIRNYWTWAIPVILTVALAVGHRNVIASGIAVVTSVFGQVGAVNIPVTTTDISTPSAPASGKTIWYTKSGSLCSENPSASEVCISSSGPTSNQNIRSWGGSFDGGGSALSSGKTTYVTVPFACTIAAYNILVDTGTASFDVWKVATGTAIPTVANTILSGGFLAISSGTALHSTTLTDFTTTTVSANDIVGINLEAVSGATFAQLVVQCNATT